ncbi:MAG TPA: helix-turn-helix domain-containing protein [Streptosporangiaceae bacterium]|jgi:transcriptional regulator GlxA family with amidase domain|nr:helix-turn-helix domain-containing protein [Streptosporangiaceae bacterium]
MAPLSRVVAYAPPGANGLALGMASAVFGRRPGITDFEFTFCSDAAGLLSTDMGLPVSVDSDVSALDSADLVLVLPGERCRSNPSPAAIAALRSARERGAIVAAHCVGVFLLAAAGLLDGLEATTHWQHSAELACMYPLVRVRPEALYLDQGGIATGAGAAAGLDLYLHLIRREIGATVANELARILVIPPHRDGGQQQFIAAPVPADADGDRLAGVIGWARENLHQDMSVETLAARALMSRRSFVRHFKAATGATPHAWLLAQRLNRAEELLESTDLPIERVAAQVGYRSAAVFREQFVLRRGVAPRDYRRTFSHAA